MIAYESIGERLLNEQITFKGSEVMIKHFFSIFLGLFAGHSSNMIFNFVVAKAPQQNIIYKMYLAESCKLLSFVVSLLLIFKFFPIHPTIFIVSVVVYLIINFIKNLLKLII